MNNTDKKTVRLGRPFSNRPNHSLSRETVITAALTIVQNSGLEKLSMKGLAESLNSSRPPLYALFADRKALVMAVVDNILLIIAPLDHLSAHSWQDKILFEAHSAFDCYNKYPGVANELIRTGFPDTAVGRNIADYYVKTFLSAGFDKQHIPSLILTITALVSGASAEITEQDQRELQLQSASNDELSKHQQRQGKTLPQQPLNRDSFSFAIKVLIQGMEALLANTTRP